jgi:predicted  nucleic acid-binding Zn-ribbon protein
MSVGSTQTSEHATSGGAKSASGKNPANAMRATTYVDVAKELAKLEERQATQRTELAETDALIAEKQKELSTLVSGIGRRKS